MDSALFNKDKEYLFNDFLVLIFMTITLCNSAFLFSIARNKASRLIDNKNQGEKSRFEDLTPAIALSKNPEDMQNISKIGSFFNLKQYAI